MNRGENQSQPCTHALVVLKYAGPNRLLRFDFLSGVPMMSSKPEITAADFPALHTFLRGYFHEDVADEYGTPPEAADQFCEDAETDERIPVAREWQQLMELTGDAGRRIKSSIEETGQRDPVERRGNSAGVRRFSRDAWR